MADIKQAMPLILRQEGVYSDDPNDPGGPTKYGISLSFLKDLPEDHGHQPGDLDRDGDVDADDVRQMTPELATWFYDNQWWSRYGYGRFTSQDIANKVFSLAVNMGAGSAHHLVQRALRAVGITVDEDGVLGDASYTAVNSLVPARVPSFLSSLRSEAAGYYRKLAALKPTSAKFLDGWLNRAYS